MRRSLWQVRDSVLLTGGDARKWVDRVKVLLQQIGCPSISLYAVACLTIDGLLGPAQVPNLVVGFGTFASRGRAYQGEL